MSCAFSWESKSPKNDRPILATGHAKRARVLVLRVRWVSKEAAVEQGAMHIPNHRPDSPSDWFTRVGGSCGKRVQFTGNAVGQKKKKWGTPQQFLNNGRGGKGNGGFKASLWLSFQISQKKVDTDESTLGPVGSKALLLLRTSDAERRPVYPLRKPKVAGPVATRRPPGSQAHLCDQSVRRARFFLMRPGPGPHKRDAKWASPQKTSHFGAHVRLRQTICGAPVLTTGRRTTWKCPDPNEARGCLPKIWDMPGSF